MERDVGFYFTTLTPSMIYTPFGSFFICFADPEIFWPLMLFALAAVPYLLVPYLASAGAMTVSASRRWRKRMSSSWP